MGLFDQLLGKRLLVELRGIRRALERQADVLELQAGTAPRSGGQAFRSFSREKSPGDGEGSGVAYVDGREAEHAYAVEQELAALLGREPTPEELERGLRGDVE